MNCKDCVIRKYYVKMFDMHFDKIDCPFKCGEKQKREMTDTTKVTEELQSASKWFVEHGRNTNTAIIGICDRAVDEINRQSAEIERLQREAKIDESEIMCIRRHRDNARAEAVKEFAERLKGYLLLTQSGDLSVVSADDINKIANEMISEQG